MNEEKSKPIYPWLTIWVRPRETMRKILDTNPYRLIIWFALLWGVLGSISLLNQLWTHYTHRPEFRTLPYILISLFGSILIALLVLYLGGWLYKLTGSWIGGKGTFVEIKCAVGWSFYPFIITSILGLLVFATMGIPWLTAIFGLLQLAALVWSFIIFLFLLAEAHKFSVLRALGTILIAYALVFAALMILGLLVPLLTPLFNK